LRTGLLWLFISVLGESGVEQREAIIGSRVLDTMFEFVEAADDGELRRAILFVLQQTVNESPGIARRVMDGEERVGLLQRLAIEDDDAAVRQLAADLMEFLGVDDGTGEADDPNTV
jgi:hypothetical protein